MKNYLIVLCLLLVSNLSAQQWQIASPDGKIQMRIHSGENLGYSVSYNGKTLVCDSPLGFEFKGEKPMSGGFTLEEFYKLKYCSTVVYMVPRA